MFIIFLISTDKSLSLCNFNTPYLFRLYSILGREILANIRSLIISSTTNCITIMNNVSAKLSPCLIPYLYLITISSLPIFKITSKLLYNFSTYLMYFSGAPINLSGLEIISYLMLLYAFTKSMKTTCVSILYSLLYWRIVSVKKLLLYTKLLALYQTASGGHLPLKAIMPLYLVLCS